MRQSLFIKVVFRSFAWACAMAFSASVTLYYQHSWETAHLARIVMLYFIGGFLAYPFARLFAGIIDRRKSFETRFAAHFLCLSLFTIGATAALYALDYWSFYQRWHAPAFSKIWILQFIGTNLGALFQFSVMGIRLFLPLGFVCLALAAYLDTKSLRRHVSK